MRMTKTKFIQLIAGGVLATSLVASSFAILAADSPSADQEGVPVPHQQKGPRHGLLLGHMAKKADLSPEQKAQVKQILDANRANVQKIEAKMHDNQLQIRKLALSDDKGKQAKIERLAKTQGELVTQMIVNNAKVTDEMRHVLTPEQVEQLAGAQQQQSSVEK
jgi:Spy/CpxP family protein refolding chaperone